MNTFETSANDEQKEAIFHQGGVLLSAGAGSGKTFVLVEHISYLIFNFYQGNQSLSKDEFEKELKKYLSNIVLMTFTKKAAGELAIRLKRKMADLVLKSIDEEQEWLWRTSTICLDSMTVGTIDGFCYKLIAQGFFPGLPQELDIVSELEAQKKILLLFNEWVVNTFGTELKDLSAIDSFFINHKEEFVKSFVKIFSSPELRMLWKEMDVDSMLEYDWDEFMQVVFGEDQPCLLSKSIPELPDKAKGAWVEKYHKLKDYFESIDQWDLTSLIKLDNFFKSNKSITTGPKSDSDMKTFFSLAKSVKDNLDKIGPELEAYEADGRKVLRPQISRMLEIFNWIENRYSQIPGFTFSDLEYYVRDGLRNEEAKTNIFNRYKYLIVDEFQDTSRVQFEIIEAIINKDFRRLFCVGDEKQAIYGFKGGELQVFKDCKTQMPKALTLSNNYRSLGNIISFNNVLFKDLFAKGLEYSGHDQFPVDFDSQLCPIDSKIGTGLIQKNNVEVQVEGKKKVGESDFVEEETTQILKLVARCIEEKPKEQICILYKGLKPSTGLITGLISRKIGLRAQVKVPYPQDPVVAIFSALIEGLLLSSQDKISLETTPAKFYISYLLKYLQVKSALTDDHLSMFAENISAIGIIPSFGSFLYELGVSNSNHPGNMAEIERICTIASNDPEEILLLLSQLKSKKYSIEFQSPGIGDVVIMTAHASKGLQFPHVILGGIHNNGRRVTDSELVGKLPGSLRWRSTLEQKKKYRSPQMIIEEKISVLKDFAESKRLFYVACTRAESRISWVDIKDSNGNDCVYSKNSWVHGLRSFEQSTENITNNNDLFDHIKTNINFINTDSIDQTAIFSRSILPTFHIDPLGATSYENTTESSLVCFPELSVTKLATISQCTRKFYLKHICKIDEDIDLDYKSFLEPTEESDDELKVSPLKSSAERGTLVHEAIAHGVTHNGLLSLAHKKELDIGSLKAVEWAVKEVLENYSDFKVVSENLLKFDFFGQMISGTPDLVLMPENTNSDKFKVIDFKTGQPNPTKEAPYWFQLKAYAHAIQVTHPHLSLNKVSLELWFVDNAEIKVESFSLSEIDQYLSDQWSKLSRPFAMNNEHCNKCSFGKFCHPDIGTVAPI